MSPLQGRVIGTMVPMRAIFEALGGWVEWTDDEPTITRWVDAVIRIRENSWMPGSEIIDWVHGRPTIAVLGFAKDPIEFQIGSYAMFNPGIGGGGDRWIQLDVPPQIVNNTTLVPLRAFVEAIGAEVDWCGDTRTVTIISPDNLW